MKFLLSWLKEFIELSVPPDSLAQHLTMAGLEVTRLSPAPLPDYSFVSQEASAAQRQMLIRQRCGAGDWLLEVEVTPNRPDLLSHLGVAREIAAVLGRPFRFPRWLAREIQIPPAAPGPVSVTLEDEQGCRRYVGVVMEGVRVGLSPKVVADRLTHLGVRPVNNIVDITNLCLFEMGQPLHAFDLDRIEGGSVAVRRARAGETLVTLDGEKRLLTPDLLVIADLRRPLALAGILGGRDSEITASTRSVFLESAWFDPILIRRGARRMKLVSDSSVRFERGVEAEMVPAAAARAARLIGRHAGGKIIGWADAGTAPAARSRIPLRPSRVQEILGAGITHARQRRILERLGCRIRSSSRGWRVEPPSWRQDLRIPEDLVEEIARLWGYERIPATLAPSPREALDARTWALEDPALNLEREARTHLSAGGFQEIFTYSLVSPSDHERVGLEKAEALALDNPLSSEYSVLRRTLLVGALQALVRNWNRKTGEAFRFFELGFRYEPAAKPAEPDASGAGGSPRQIHTLSLLVAGLPAPRWGGVCRPLGVLDLKGAAALLFERLGLPLADHLETGDPEFPYLRRPFVVWKSEGSAVGVAGELDPGVRAAFDLPGEIPVAYAELNLGEMAARPRVPVRVPPLPKAPAVVRDLALVVSEEVPQRQIEETIRLAGQPILQDAALFDLYRGRQIPAGKKSLAFRLRFSAGDRTLTDPEIAEIQKRILDRLSSRFQATLR